MSLENLSLVAFKILIPKVPTIRPLASSIRMTQKPSKKAMERIEDFLSIAIISMLLTKF